jgi:hypothetical protein
MTLEALTLLFLVVGALALVLIEMALSPESGRFPCSGPGLRWCLRLYAVAIFNRAAILFVGVYLKHAPVSVAIDIFLGAAGMCLTHVFICWRVLGSRLPVGVWARLQRRAFPQRVRR